MKALAGLIGVALLALGCGGIGVSELPAKPIALRWFDAEALRGRSELVEEELGLERRPPQGMPSVDDFRQYLGRVLGVENSAEQGQLAERIESRYPGRLAFGDPRNDQIDRVDLLAGTLPRAWSPDGKKLLVTQLVSGFRQLFLLVGEDREIQRVTRGPAVHADGCFGPDGRLVLVETNINKGRPWSRLLITAPGGAHSKEYTAGPADYAPACAPDGSSVVWVMVTPRGRDIMMSRSPVLDGEARRLGPGRDPSFSADSEWIVYTAEVGRRWALHRIRPDGSGRRQIGTGSFNEVQPSLSPDGRFVVYVSDNGIDQRFHIRRFDGTGDRVLFPDGGGTDPVW